MKLPSIDSNTADTPASIARGLLYATALVPAVVIPGFFFPYVTTRAVYFRVLVQLATAILLYLVVRRQITVNYRRDFVLWALAAWVAANMLAAAFGASPIRSIFGDHERMGGVWFWIHLVAYYVLLCTFFGPRHWTRFFRLNLGVATLIATYGLVQQWFRPFKPIIGGIAEGVTVGNPGLLAPYLLASLSLCVILALLAEKPGRLVYGAIGTVLVTAVVVSGNRGSTLGLLIGAGVALACYTIWSGRLRGWRIPMVIALLAAAAALPLLARASWTQPVTSRVWVLSKLASGVDSSRVIQWRAAFEGIRNRPLLGVGPENYQIVWSSYYHPEMYRFTADSRWDRAHNAFLDAFATAGILGVLSLLAVFLALGWSAREAARRAEQRADGKPELGPSVAVESVALGFTAAYAFYLFFWFFDLNSTMLWIALGAFVTTRATTQPLIEFGAPHEKRWQSSVVLGAGAITLAAVLYVHGFETLRMARNLDRVRNPSLSQAQVLEGYRAVFGSPAPASQHVFVMYAAYLASLRPRFEEIQSSAVNAALFDRAFILAIEEFERQAVRDPLNERITVQHARVLILGAYYYGNMRLYESALRRLQRAVELAPRRVPTRLSLGMAYLNVQRPREALAEFDRAYALYPPFGQTRAYVGLAHASLQQHGEAVRWLERAMDAGYELDRAILTRVARDVADAGDPALGGQLLRHYLTNKYGPASMWPMLSAGDAVDYRLATTAAEFFTRGGNSTAASGVVAEAAGLCRRAAPLTSLAASAIQSRPVDAGDCHEPWRSGTSWYKERGSISDELRPG
ncbi:MAG: O-antigen ligase family protein [Gemmatimonadaceae bacterium]|nr:O-antigen ligase family protein [Gemmatimonadaceae bacterium]